MGMVRCGACGKKCCWRCDRCPSCDNAGKILRGDYCAKCTAEIKALGGLWSEYRKDYVENQAQLDADNKARAELHARQAGFACCHELHVTTDIDCQHAGKPNAAGELCPCKAPRIEQTQAGPQTVIDGTPERAIPSGPLKPKRPQTEKPLALEMPAIEAQQGKLF